MLQHVFAVLNELLDDIMIRYPGATDEQRAQMEEQLAVLQSMSDSMIDGWLQLEEKLAGARQFRAPADSGEDPLAPAADSEANASIGPPDASQAMNGADDGEEAERSLAAGQGYFNLLMFREAAAHFRQTVRFCPDSVVARLFLAMSHLHLREWEEAQRHFQLIVRWTSHPKWKALGLNALGCIQAVRANMEQAEKYFAQAFEADPTFDGAARNLTSCRSSAGKLSLYFGSAELSCM